MSEWNEILSEEMETLRQVRDELRVQAHLGRAEFQERWKGLEKRWEELEGRMKRAGEVAKHDSSDVKDAAKLLMEELRAGYDHLKSQV